MYNVITQNSDSKIIFYGDSSIVSGYEGYPAFYTVTSYADEDAAVAANPALDSLVKIQNAVKNEFLRTTPFNAAFYLPDVWVGHPQTVTISGQNISLAQFDGELLYVQFTKPWADGNYRVRVSGGPSQGVQISTSILQKDATSISITVTQLIAVGQSEVIVLQVY